MTAKSKGHRYTVSEKAQALQLYQEHGPTVAARRTGIPYETIRRWAIKANVLGGDPNRGAAEAHANAAARISQKWVDVREAEANAAGDTAIQVRTRLLELIHGEDSQMLRAITDAYDKLITKAELLSGQATDRIAVWAEQDLDRELKELVKRIEDQTREAIPASRKALEAGEDEVVVEIVDSFEIELDVIELRDGP